MTTTPARRFVRGLSLVEMCITLAIVGVLSLSAILFSRGMTQQQLQRGVAVELAADLQWLRMEVSSRAQPLRLTLQRDAAGSCYLIHSGPADACRCNADGPALCEGAASLVKAVHLPAALGVSISGTAASTVVGPERLSFSPALSLNVARAGSPTIRHVVAITGRVRTCAEGGRAGGYKACD